ncbi:hypothetical protein BD769DRAFT_1390529 [Suillus cothurnatus]|nr:hypothetical protein BD769DRAFT_1390529 [Suillus cothurnatus]
MYSITQMQKAKKQCKSINTFLVLSPKLEFDTIKAQILEKISEGLKPKIITFEHYSVAWTIPRTQASSMLLCSPTDYQFLLNLASKQKTPSVNLVIKARLLKNKKTKSSKKNSEDSDEESRDSESGNSDSGDEDERLKKKSKVVF